MATTVPAAVAQQGALVSAADEETRGAHGAPYTNSPEAGVVRDINHAFTRLLGYPREVVVGQVAGLSETGSALES